MGVFKKAQCKNKAFPDIRDTDLDETETDQELNLQEWTKAFVMFAIHLSTVLITSIVLYLSGYFDKPVGLSLT